MDVSTRGSTRIERKDAPGGRYQHTTPEGRLAVAGATGGGFLDLADGCQPGGPSFLTPKRNKSPVGCRYPRSKQPYETADGTSPVPTNLGKRAPARKRQIGQGRQPLSRLSAPAPQPQGSHSQRILPQPQGHQPQRPAGSPQKSTPTPPVRAEWGYFNYAALPDCAGLTCTVRPAWSGDRNDPRQPSGSCRTGPWRGRGRRGTGGCNGSRWPGSPDTLPSCRPWRSG